MLGRERGTFSSDDSSDYGAEPLLVGSGFRFFLNPVAEPRSVSRLQLYGTGIGDNTYVFKILPLL